jgi:hypothetical protein
LGWRKGYAGIARCRELGVEEGMQCNLTDAIPCP